MSEAVRVSILELLQELLDSSEVRKKKSIDENFVQYPIIYDSSWLKIFFALLYKLWWVLWMTLESLIRDFVKHSFIKCRHGSFMFEVFIYLKNNYKSQNVSASSDRHHQLISRSFCVCTC